MAIRMNRRRFFAYSGATFAAGALMPRRGLAQDVSLRLQWWGSQPRAERTFEVVNLYQQQNPDVAITGETIGWSDYWTRLATQVAGRNAPDVMQMDYRYITEYARRGALAPLGQFRDSVLGLEGFSDNALAGGMVDGELYGVSLGANSSAMMINQAAFEAAGLDLPNHQTTWAEIKEIALKIKEAGHVPYGIEDASGDEPTLENWLRQQGKALYTEEGDVAFSVEDITAWFDHWADLREAGATVPPDTQALSQDSIETAMTTLGYAAMSFAHTNQLVGYRALNEDPIVMSTEPLVEPGATGGHYRKPSQMFSIYNGASSPEEAARFINYFVTDFDAAKVLDVERGVPESAPVREMLLEVLDEADQAQIRFIEDLGDAAGPLPPPPPNGAGEIDTTLIRISQQVAFGQQSSAEGAEEFVGEALSIRERS